MSSRSLPDGVREGDPRAPWNEATKGECGTCTNWNGHGGLGVCELEFERAFDLALITSDGLTKWRMACWALEWSISHLKDETCEACPRWKEA